CWLVKESGDGLFGDEWLAHSPDHSTELEVLFLQYLYGSVLQPKRPIRIVPLVVGSFQDCVLNGQQPRYCPEIAALTRALQKVEAETKEPICYIISGDLAHIGPKFNSAAVLDARRLEPR